MLDKICLVEEFSSPQGPDCPNAFLILMLNSEPSKHVFFLIILSFCYFWFDVFLSNVMVFIDFFKVLLVSKYYGAILYTLGVDRYVFPSRYRFLQTK